MELSADEANIEKLCDEERYLELHTDMAEKTMYEEEEWKRYYESLSEGYKAVGFSYDSYGQLQNADPVAEAQKLSPEDMPFVPAPELQVPAGVQIPATVKENAIIEKTAKFIAEHGVQMEIVMKTKQANNQSFQFMHFENILHLYYKHLVKMIKSKKYIPPSPVKLEREDSLNESGDHNDGSHGYLHPTLMSSRDSPAREPIKPVPLLKVEISETSYGQLLQSFSRVNKEHEEKNKAKELLADVKREAGLSDSALLLPQPAYESSVPPPPGLEPVLLPRSITVKQEPPDESPPSEIVPPPPDAQPIIDRMAMYVAKNGDEFAMVVKSKNDPRFQFLETWHPHYAYYDFKRHLFQEEIEKKQAAAKKMEQQREADRAEQLARGVKFTLRKVKDAEVPSTLDKKPAFTQESSDEEGECAGTSKGQAIPQPVSGSTTAVQEGAAALTQSKSDEGLEKRLAEQRLKDRITASAREKLSQADREAQMKSERKKKAAMFINLLKSQNNVEAEAETNTDTATKLDIQVGLPLNIESKRHKHKTRDRSRSHERKRSKRSRSRSQGRSKKKKGKRLKAKSPIQVKQRSPVRPRQLPPTTRSVEMRQSLSPSVNETPHEQSRLSERSSQHRSMSKHRSRSRSKGPSSKLRSRSRSNDQSSKHASKSRSKSHSTRKRSRSKSVNSKNRSRSRSKSRRSKRRSRSVSHGRSKAKKKRSRSPLSRKEEAKSRRGSKKKKKKSHSRVKGEVGPQLPIVHEESPNRDRVTSFAAIAKDSTDVNTRESTPEPGQTRNSTPELGKAKASTLEPGETRESTPELRQTSDSTPKSRQTRDSSPELGQTRDSTPEPGQISDTFSEADQEERSPTPTADIGDTLSEVSNLKPARSSKSRSFSPASLTEFTQGCSTSPSSFPMKHRFSLSSDHISRSKSGSRSLSRASSKSLSRSKSKSRSISNSKSRSRSVSRSRSRSLSRSKSISRSRSESMHRSNSRSQSVRSDATPQTRTGESSPGSISREVTPAPDSTAVNGTSSGAKKNVSSYMLSRVRELLKASKASVREDMFADDSS
ncbi:splicing factor, suppressor of white-apricot homolog isoform X2 [Dreissena polymorpha]|nr:splicing factor, suppressor of white-apricot homolog isoform X2 [Dreissena polymorpha]